MLAIFQTMLILFLLVMYQHNKALSLAQAYDESNWDIQNIKRMCKVSTVQYCTSSENLQTYIKHNKTDDEQRTMEVLMVAIIISGWRQRVS